MTSRPPSRARRPRPATGRALVAAVAAVCVLAGCRSRDGGGLNGGIGMGGGGGLASRGDPLFGGAKIPPQNLPIPSRGENAARSRDPLLTPGRATGDTRTATGGKSKDRASLPPTREDPYRPTRSQTAAALAGRIVPWDDLGLSIGDRNSTITPAGGFDEPAPSRGADSAELAGQVATELRSFAATWDPPVRTATGYQFRCTVPIGSPGSDGRPGLIRQYEGIGPTPAAAARDALTQIRGDVGSR